MFISHRAMMGGGIPRVEVTVTISSNTNNYILQPSAIPGYESGNTDITFIINSGVVVGSTSTGATALTIRWFAAGDSVSVTNNGYIVGKGGNGGSGYIYGGSTPGAGAGGRALSTNFAVSMTNNGTIGGGGGGGGGSYYHEYYVYAGYNGKDSYWAKHAGNGGGGGAGRNAGSGGAVGSYNNGFKAGGWVYGAAGSGGGLTGGGAGGSCSHGNTGGTGGALGASGGGSWAGGAAGGACTSGNSYITWVTTGTRAGALN